MDTLIRLLPDSIANQIAAGEVIQRPASVVKELLENAVDAGSTAIHLKIIDSGKTLIQITDNGCGMNEADLRMSIERHATSKIRKADDLFAIRTMGFRGEAMASIASIAHLHIKTKTHDAELGSLLHVEGSEVAAQEPVQCAQGTTIQVKNLFFNVPARRKFLKSDQVEYRHIIDEFQRVALPNPRIKFTFHHGDHEVFHLNSGNFRQRIVSIFGKNYNNKLVPVDEETSILKVHGFVINPQETKKTRGDQFLFANKRFIKSGSINHAINDAVRELLPSGHHAGYFLNLEMDPTTIDINIHPTKTEIKFEDERATYSIINAAIKQGIGKHNISPSLDFNQEISFNVPLHPTKEISAPTISVDTSFNPFHETKKKKAPVYTGENLSALQQSNKENWEKLYAQNPDLANMAAPHMLKNEGEENSTKQISFESSFDGDDEKMHGYPVFQLHRKYILTQTKRGFMLIHQKRAHERILFEQMIKAMAQEPLPSQQQLFPEHVELSSSDAELIKSMHQELQFLGFDISNFGKNTFVIQGVPAFAGEQEIKGLLESVLENQKLNQSANQLEKQEALARAMANQTAIQTGKKLLDEEMRSLIDQLFACENPSTSPTGKLVMHNLAINELDQLFNR